MNNYLCPKCSAIIQRDSDKKKIKSQCDETGKPVVLTRIESADKLAVILRKRFLKNNLRLESFTPKERLFLYSAFEQGAKVVYNRLRLFDTKNQ